MTKLLDFRTSQHASFVGSITIPLEKGTPVMFGPESFKGSVYSD
ncbi:hypothetical protein [Paenibacillus kobensis]|nr:hypothetical protein [Paenibacillus kobensis]